MDSLNTLLDWARVPIVLPAILILLIWFHELGHYLTARLFGMHVDAFAVMVGGLRKTDLAGFLERPIAPSWIPWATAAFLGVEGILAWLLKIPAGVLLAMTGLFVALPVWVALRLKELYHLPTSFLVKSFAYAGGAAVLAVWVGTRMQNVTAFLILPVLGGAFSIANVVTYYSPVTRKGDTEEMGHGIIEIEGQEVAIRYRPVWFRTGKDGTEYSLLALPLGGFASIRGMHPKEDGSETQIQGGFYSKPPWQRLLVLFAGPLFSMILGVALIAASFMGEGIVEGMTTKLRLVSEKSAAAAAGLQPGDTIQAIDGQRVASMYDIVKLVRDNYKSVGNKLVPGTVQLTYLRNGKEVTSSIQLTLTDEPVPVIGPDYEDTGDVRRQCKLGILGEPNLVHVGPAVATAKALEVPFDVVASLAKTVSKPRLAQENVGSVGTVASTTKEAASEGLWQVLALAGGLSITLGVMNLLPIVPLDGGQIVIAVLDMFHRGRRLHVGIQSALQQVGVILILLLTFFAIAQDLRRSASPEKPAIVPAKK